MVTVPAVSRATANKRFLKDALLAWNGDKRHQVREDLVPGEDDGAAGPVSGVRKGASLGRNRLLFGCLRALR